MVPTEVQGGSPKLPGAWTPPTPPPYLCLCLMTSKRCGNHKCELILRRHCCCHKSRINFQSYGSGSGYFGLIRIQEFGLIRDFGNIPIRIFWSHPVIWVSSGYFGLIRILVFLGFIRIRLFWFHLDIWPYPDPGIQVSSESGYFGII
mgnify:CR=1 FL=1